MSTSVDYYQLREDMRALSLAVEENASRLRAIADMADPITQQDIRLIAGQLEHALLWPHHRSHADRAAVAVWEKGPTTTVQWPSDHDTEESGY